MESIDEPRLETDLEYRFGFVSGFIGFGEDDIKVVIGAAELFEDGVWQAISRYRGGDFASSAAQFAERGDTRNLYNLGNALAMQGDFETAIDAYEQVLEMDPDNVDAEYNRDLLKELQSEQEQQQQEGESQQSDQESGGESEESDSESNSEQQSDAQSDSESEGDPSAYQRGVETDACAWISGVEGGNPA